MRQLAEGFYRLVGLAVTLLGAWVLYINLADISYSGWVLVWILSAGLLGAVGGVLFLLSFDGPPGARTRKVRLLGWLGMLFLALLPWSFQFVMLPLVLLTLPALATRTAQEVAQITTTDPERFRSYLKPSRSALPRAHFIDGLYQQEDRSLSGSWSRGADQLAAIPKYSFSTSIGMR